MNVAVFGLGYVGSVSAGCLAARGHEVIGVDLDPAKVLSINEGRSPVLEAGLEEMLREACAAGTIRATTDPLLAVSKADISIVCVGTPSGDHGVLDLAQVQRVTCQIAHALRAVGHYHVVVYRSTMLPGTVEEQLVPVLTRTANRRLGEDLGIAVSPEFLREGSGLSDFYRPSRILIGATDERSGDLVDQLFDVIEAPRVRTSIRVAEMVKYADNAFHALKVAYANEMGRLCKEFGIDARELMSIFCMDRRLNLSEMYLTPGNAFGGSCLPKDVRALVRHAHKHGVDIPVLDALLPSNTVHKQSALDLVRKTGARRVAILGLSFKPGTDDLRESPSVELAETLIGKGYELLIYDPDVSVDRLVGSNRAYVEREIPHVACLMRNSLSEACGTAEAIVITRQNPEFADVIPRLGPNQKLIDLVGIIGNGYDAGNYVGICW